MKNLYETHTELSLNPWQQHLYSPGGYEPSTQEVAVTRDLSSLGESIECGAWAKCSWFSDPSYDPPPGDDPQPGDDSPPARDTMLH